MPITQEEAWAAALQKSRQELAKNMRVPVGVQKKRLADDLVFLKRTLFQACTAHDLAVVVPTLDSLFRVRAEQAALALRELEEIYSTPLEQATLNAYGKQYAADCASLVTAVRALLKK